MPARRFISAALLIASTAASVNAQFNRESGAYVFRTYSAAEYGASLDNWAIAAAKNGVLYSANTDGVLSFDGVTWRSIPLSNKFAARSLSIDAKGTIYVGGVGEFGLLQPDATGELKYSSLLSHVPQEFRAFADVWRVLPTPAGLYFSCYSRLFRLNPDNSVKVWSPKSRFGKAFVLGNDLYVKTPERGLIRMSGDDWVNVPGGERFAGLPVEGGVQSSAGLLIATRDGFFKLTDSGVDPYPTSADSYFTKNKIYSAASLSNGLLAVGTQSGGLVLLNSAGELERIVSRQSGGLPDNFVTAIQQDSTGAVWLTSSTAIVRFDLGLTSFGKQDGLDGDVQVVARQGAAIVTGTSAGVFRMTPQQGAPPLFEPVEGQLDRTWCFLPFQGTLLAGSHYGVSAISGNKAIRILEKEIQRTIWDLSPSRRDPNLLYAAGAGVFKIRKVGENWESAGVAAPAGQEFRTVLEDDDGRVWATTSQEIWRFDFRQQPAVAEKFGTDKGVPLGFKNARRLQGHITFATDKGLKRYSESLKRFAPDVTVGDEFANGKRDVFNIFEGPNGDVWVTGVKYHELLSRQKDGTYKRTISPLVRSKVREIYWLHIDDDGTVWALGDESVLYRWEPSLAGNPDRNFSVLTRRVQVPGQPEAVYGGDGNVSSIRLPFSSNALRFEFAAPYYEQPDAVEYQVQLEGSDRNWTPWSHETHVDRTNLSEGSYRFRVRARSPHGTVAEQSSFTFGVFPPWYRSWWAYLIYLALGGVGVYGIVQWRTRQLKEDKHKLELIVEERTVEIREQRDEIQIQEHKSRELLLNILPVKVADELKATGSVQPVGFDDVTVCFTDFVGFTLSSEKLAPGKLVNSLNKYFTAFDEIIARYGLEKLKTIGDSYMFVSGLPVQRKSHAVDAVLAALEMVQVVKTLAEDPDGTKWGIRVGLHSGPVVAGVVGIRKFAFDIWGNTVNFAARMESSGVPGNVNMSERTCSLLHGLIDTEFRGDVKIKEGRSLPMYLAQGPNTFDAAEFTQRYEREFGEQAKSFPALLAEVAWR